MLNLKTKCMIQLLKKNKIFVTVLFSNLILMSNVFSQTQEYFPDPNPLIQQKLEQWKDMKFGLLMHWGPYSQWSVVESWSICPEDVGWATGARLEKRPNVDYNSYVKEYENLQTTFNPSKFDPEKWAAAAKDAGMKYVVFTTKHHDGFCMFDTKTTNYKITDKNTPFSTNKRSNVVKEVFNAFRNENLWVGAYFSKPDWHSEYYWWNRFPAVDRNVNYDIKKHPDRWKQFVDYTHTQIDELMSDYGKVDILWLDGGWVRRKTEEQARKDYIKNYDENHFGINSQNQDIDMALLTKKARVKQPGLIVVDRDVPGEQQNYLTPEQHIPETGLPYPWETCMTMAGSWSYAKDDVYKPTKDLINKLVDIVSKGGNYLLNVGPSPEGEWHDEAYQRMTEIGKWIRTNGEGIYNSRMAHVFGEGDKIRFTQSKDGKTKFIFLFDFPQDKILVTKLPIAKNAIVQMLGAEGKLKYKQVANGTEINIPASYKVKSDYVWVLKVQE
jgi:alpha-L-fucosidase